MPSPRLPRARSGVPPPHNPLHPLKKYDKQCMHRFGRESSRFRRLLAGRTPPAARVQPQADSAHSLKPLPPAHLVYGGVWPLLKQPTGGKILSERDRFRPGGQGKVRTNSGRLCWPALTRGQVGARVTDRRGWLATNVAYTHCQLNLSRQIRPRCASVPRIPTLHSHYCWCTPFFVHCVPRAAGLDTPAPGWAASRAASWARCGALSSPPPRCTARGNAVTKDCYTCYRC